MRLKRKDLSHFPATLGNFATSGRCMTRTTASISNKKDYFVLCPIKNYRFFLKMLGTCRSDLACTEAKLDFKSSALAVPGHKAFLGHYNCKAHSCESSDERHRVPESACNFRTSNEDEALRNH